MSTDENPYIVSADVGRLMKEWAKKSGYSVPPIEYFENASKDLGEVLETVIPEPVEVVSQKELKTEMDSFASQAKYPIISLDRAYVDDKTPNILGFLDLTRAVDEDLNDLGLQPRPGYPSVEQQIYSFKEDSVSPVTLLDDVVFSGEGIVDICKRLKSVNHPVDRVIVGIGVGEGIQKLREMGIAVDCVREYPQVYDEICERDFFAGVPMSGRTVIPKFGETLSAPYFLPFGNPEKWASIPNDGVKEFSDFCIIQSLMLWKEIEDLSGKEISTGSIPRRVRGLDDYRSVSRALRSSLAKNG